MGKHTLEVLHAKEYNEMSSDELRELLSTLKLRKMVIMANVKRKSVKPIVHLSGEARQNRKAIARIMTILVQRKERCV